MNVTDSDSVQKAFDQVFERFGGLDALINNAGITRDQLLLRMKDEDFFGRGPADESSKEGPIFVLRPPLSPCSRPAPGQS